jgi:hypothetical protein
MTAGCLSGQVQRTLDKQVSQRRAKLEKEEEAARKLRYPIADELLPFEPPPPTPLAEWPAPRCVSDPLCQTPGPRARAQHARARARTHTHTQTDTHT